MMRMDSQPHMSCNGDDCESYVLIHRWARIRAYANGWFFTRDGKVFCPEHTPEYVKRWRSQKPKT